MRLFVSVDLPDALAEAVESVQDELREASGLSFTDPTQTHVTLKFLGETDERRLADLEGGLESAVDAAGVGPFEATVGGLGAFPSEDYIRVVWVGFEAGGERLTRLHEAVEPRTVALGFDPEAHDFTPHVTLARMEHAGGKELVQQVLREHEPTLGTMPVDEIRLTESQLGPDGPEYTTLGRFEL
jgi:2'-5' RNA ligase